MNQRTEIVQVKMANGKIMHVEVKALGGEEDVAFGLPSFEDVSEAIEGISESLSATIEKLKPRKASIEFGLELAVESGKLTALLVSGSGTASLKITLEWGNP